MSGGILYMRKGVRLLREEHVFLRGSSKGRLRLLTYFEVVTGEPKRLFNGPSCSS